MGSRFEKFTERARRVLSLSQEEAQRFNHNYIGTEHILLGLIRETESVAARVLSRLSVDQIKVRSTVDLIIGRTELPVFKGEFGITLCVKRVVQMAVDEARRMKHTYVGTEHLLIGLLREGEGVAAGVLEMLSVNLDKVRAETNRLMSDTADEYLDNPPSDVEGTSHPTSAYGIAIIGHVSAIIDEISRSPDFDTGSVAEITIQLLYLRDDLLALEEETPNLESMDSLHSLIRTIAQAAPSMKDHITSLLNHPIIAGIVGASYIRYFLS